MEGQKEKLDVYIKEMAHYDPDNMEMGAREVSELVIGNALNLQENLNASTQIIQAFLKQMQSDNYNVLANAITCVGNMISKFPSTHAQKIYEKTILSIADPNLDEKKRQIYGVCAGTIIHRASQQFGPMLCYLFVYSVKILLEKKQARIPIELILINVISQFIRKWANVAGNKKTVFDRKGLIVYLLNNIENRGNIELIMKSQSALGKLAMILDKQYLEMLLNDHNIGLLPFIKKNIGIHNQSNLKNVRDGLICLSFILKTHNSDLRAWALLISTITIEIINIYKKDPEIDKIDIICDIIESAIDCLAYNLKSFSRQLSNQLHHQTQPLSNFVKDLVNFDVEGMMGYATKDEDMIDQSGYDDDSYYYENDLISDQKCWKVRKSVLNYLSILIKKDKSFREKNSKKQQFLTILGRKLIQQNNMVNQAAILSFNSLLDIISTQKQNYKQQDIEQLNLMKVKSSETDFATLILTQVEKRMEVIYSSSKFNDQNKTQATKLLLRILHLYKNDLQYHQPLANKIIILTELQFQKCKIVENRINLLLIMRILIQRQLGFNSYKKMLEIFIKSISQTNFKIVSLAFKSLNRMLQQFVIDMLKYKDFNLIIEKIIAKLQQHDADRPIKKSILGCLGCIFNLYFQKIDIKYQDQLLDCLLQKLKIEIQKTQILRQIPKLTSNYFIKSQHSKIFIEILKKVIDNLGNKNFDLNLQAIQSTKKLIQIIQKYLDKNIVGEILQKSKILLLESNLPSYIGLLMDNYPQEFKNYIQTIVKTVDSDIINKMIQLKIVDIKTCIGYLKQNAKQEKIKKISFILGKIGVSSYDLIKQIDDSLWGQICMGGLGYIGDSSNIDYLLTLMKQNNKQQLKFETCSALGNIASRNHDKILPLLIAEADKSADCYIYIYTIRQMLNFTTKEFNNIDKLTQWLLSKSEIRHEGQSIYYIISQCIGNIAILSNQVLSNILQNIKKLSSDRKYVIASSLRFAFQNKQNIMLTQQIQKFICQIIQLAGDNDVNVRYGSMKSLSSIISLHYHTIKNLLHQQFFKILKKNLLIHDQLIVEVDYGITKQKKDQGKPLRLESFNFLKSAINKLQIEGHIYQLMQICLDKINKQTSTDLILKRLNILKLLCQKDFSLFIPLQNQFMIKLGAEEGILKSYTVQKEGEDQRIQVYLKSILKQISEIDIIAQKENSDQIRRFILNLHGIPRYGDILNAFQKQK